MPWGDQTGPAGMGRMSGRGLGFCAGYDSPGYTRGAPMGGRGFGRGFRGRFMQAPVQPAYPARMTPADEKQILKEEIEMLKQERKAIEQDLKDIEKRLKELK